MNITSLVVALFICLPAIVLATQRSSWLIDYLIAVVAFNRGIRRFVDYQNGFFDQYSPISLTPLIVSGLAALLVLQQLQARKGLGRVSNKALRWYVTACTLAFVIGFIRTKLGAVFELGNYLGPLGMLGFGVLYADQRKVMRRWGVSAAIVGIGVAAYGLYQFYTIPPWDAFWLKAVDFVGYMGIPEPTKMTLFSTLNERGPAASFLASTVILIALRPKLLGGLRWPAVGLAFYAMLLTYSRTTVIQVGLAVVSLPVVTKGRGLVTLAIVAGVLAVFGESILASLPGGDRLTQRYSTLGNISEDGSFRGRMMLVGLALRETATEPLGLGMGSHGLASRVASGEGGGMGDSTGYLEILRTFGWVGTGLIVALLVQLWKSSTYVWRRVPNDSDTNLFRAWFVSGMVVLFSGNWLAGVSYFWLLAGYVLGKHDQLRSQAIEMRGTRSVAYSAGCRWKQSVRYRGPEQLWRFSIWLNDHRCRRLSKLVKVLNYLLHRALLPSEAQIGPGLILEHYALGVVIHPNVTIGRDCRIYHHVTIAGEMPIGAPERVVIGDNVTIGVNAVILPRPYQGLTIGDDATIGAGAVVTKDVPPRAVVVGVPGKVVRFRNELSTD